MIPAGLRGTCESGDRFRISRDWIDMHTPMLNRRTLLKAAIGMAATGMVPARAFAQASTQGRAAKALPPRAEFVIRGATVLTMDAKLGDFERGDVHVRNGAIVAVAPTLAAPGAATID